MSRIGRAPVNIPKGVIIDIQDHLIKVKGPKGELVQSYHPSIYFEQSVDTILVLRKDDQKQSKAFHGLYRSLINNMVKGVSEGYKKVLEINGVGYRAEPKGKNLLFSLGYSTQIEYETPEGITLSLEGKGNTTVIVNGIDKAAVGQCASEIVSLRPPEPYKGKGIKYADKPIRRKVGKSGIK